MGKQIVVALLLVAASVLAFTMFNTQTRLKGAEAIPTHIQKAFQEWKIQYKRFYASPEEHKYRLSAFYKSYLKIKAIESMNLSFTVGLNKFADLSEEEYRGKYLTLKEPKDWKIDPKRTFSPNTTNDDVPDWIDWREKGAVNEIVAQGRCGSCWAFVGMVAVEGAWKIAGNNLEKFAEQELVDCGDEFGGEGCNGGWMEYVYRYIIAKGGIPRGSDYPYTAMKGQCKPDKSKYVGHIKDYLTIPEGECHNMLLALTYNPVATAIDAGYMPYYTSGVYDYPQCGDWLNHAVSVVGYGTDWGNGKKYWLVRNTFGKDWGEAGYIRMDRDVQTKTGLCGLCKRSSFPVVK